MRKTFFALFFALLIMACSKSEEETTQSSIDDVVGVWEATADEETLKGVITLTLANDETFLLRVNGLFQGTTPFNYPIQGSFKYEYPNLTLTSDNSPEAKCIINETKNELTIEHEVPLINGRVLKKK